MDLKTNIKLITRVIAIITHQIISHDDDDVGRNLKLGKTEFALKEGHKNESFTEKGGEHVELSRWANDRDKKGVRRWVLRQIEEDE